MMYDVPEPSTLRKVHKSLTTRGKPMQPQPSVGEGRRASWHGRSSRRPRGSMGRIGRW
ncbi:uncharacterized protein CMC5_052720 [Chondromyces crocatus]|uniref:Uncharacterized protein n=1 Tax=Chondromyces crocatus TaxID=52 RepID=A0A0K1EJS3_CHOCO|nr:uncharacterized protein CMC5_052720 [Chondromyces crocatus]